MIARLAARFGVTDDDEQSAEGDDIEDPVDIAD